MYSGGLENKSQHYNTIKEKLDYLTTRCEKMDSHGYTRGKNEMIRYIYLILLNRYKFELNREEGKESECGVKISNIENILYLIFDDVIRVEESTINMNEEPDVKKHSDGVII
ncbi:hypothetical protein CWI36_0217p0020 [Hamiltosporidium magnivora]|uniref:Uncharacterized protein n=1 Tax=Hamiltosporidium magnivora TaxID=148818 RepID=A0A4Q9LIC0_9MICR|nr:hypothetical protein CWI36_0217p0020 [Hamiltosporidium magnivora]